MFEVVFDYGEHDRRPRPRPDDDGELALPPRPVLDLPRRVRGPHLPALPAGADVPPLPATSRTSAPTASSARPTSPTGARAATATTPARPSGRVIPRVASTQSGYIGAAAGGYLKRVAAAARVRVQRADDPRRRSHELDPDSLENLPDRRRRQRATSWVDLDGEGLPGVLDRAGRGLVLQAQPRATRRTVRRLEPRRAGRRRAARSPRSAAARSSSSTSPATASSTSSTFGAADCRVLRARRRTATGTPFAPFESLPEPRLGRPEPAVRRPRPATATPTSLITEDDAFTWYPSLGEDGLRPRPSGCRQPLDEERGPAARLRRRHAVDLPRRHVRRRAAPTSCGSATARSATGRTSATAASAPRSRWTTRRWFDDAGPVRPGAHPPRRHRRLAAPTDSSTCGRDGVRLYFNQSGNGWSDAATLRRASRADDAVVDQRRRPARQRHRLPGLVVAAARRRRPAAALRRPDGRQKPHLLVAVAQQPRRRDARRVRAVDEVLPRGPGGGTAVGHPAAVPGPRRRAGRDATTTSAATGSSPATPTTTATSTASSASSAASAWSSSGTPRSSARSTPAASCRADQPRRGVARAAGADQTWFHTGALVDGDASRAVRGRVLPRAGALPASRIAARGHGAARHDPAAGRASLPHRPLGRGGARGLPRAEGRRCCARRSTRSTARRRAGGPYTRRRAATTPSSCCSRAATNRHAVFFTHAARDASTLHYERELYPVGDADLADPRVTHSSTLEVDDFGNVLERASRSPTAAASADPDAAASRTGATQAPTSSRCTENGVTNAVDAADALPHAAAVRDADLRADRPGTRAAGSTIASASTSSASVADAAASARSRTSSEPSAAAGVAEAASIEHVRTLYRRDDLSGPLPLGAARVAGAAVRDATGSRSRRRWSTERLRTARRRPTADAARPKAGYVHSDGDAELVDPVRPGASTRRAATDTAAQELAHAREHFFLPRRFRDPFGRQHRELRHLRRVRPARRARPATRSATASRSASATRPTDARPPDTTTASCSRRWSWTRTATAPRSPSTPSGMVVGTAVMGKPERRRSGDSLDAAFDADLADGRDRRASSPIRWPTPPRLLGAPRLASSTTCSPTGARATATAAARRRHARARDARQRPAPRRRRRGSSSRFAYSDGFGREIQRRCRPSRTGPRSRRAGRSSWRRRRPALTPNDVARAGSAPAGRSSTTRASRSGSTSRSSADTHRVRVRRAGSASARSLFYDPRRARRRHAAPRPHLGEGRLRPVAAGRRGTSTTRCSIDRPGGRSRRRRRSSPAAATPTTCPTWHDRRIGRRRSARRAAGRATRRPPTPTRRPSPTSTRSAGRSSPSPTTGSYSGTPRRRRGVRRDPRRARHRGQPAARSSTPHGRTVVRATTYDMLGNRIRDAEHGGRRALDAARRRRASRSAPGTAAGTASAPSTTRCGGRPSRFVRGRQRRRDVLVERTVYGEAQPTPSARNLRGAVSRQLRRGRRRDQRRATTSRATCCGVSRAARRTTTRRRSTGRRAVAARRAQRHAASTDATTRSTARPSSTTPDGTARSARRYNEASLLERVDGEPARRAGRRPSDAVRHRHRLRRQGPARR